MQRSEEFILPVVILTLLGMQYCLSCKRQDVYTRERDWKLTKRKRESSVIEMWTFNLSSDANELTNTLNVHLCKTYIIAKEYKRNIFYYIHTLEMGNTSLISKYLNTNTCIIVTFGIYNCIIIIALKLMIILSIDHDFVFIIWKILTWNKIINYIDNLFLEFGLKILLTNFTMETLIGFRP